MKRAAPRRHLPAAPSAKSAGTAQAGSPRGRCAFVLSGPSGGGKTTLARALLAQVPALRRTVSVTTRPPRHSEREGADYHFVSARAFARLRRQGRLLEWARVHGAYYGTPRAEVARAWKRRHDALLCIDVQGARQVRRHLGRTAVLIFLLPPSLEDLKCRLERRRTESANAIGARLRVARRELACVRWYDYAVVNQRVDDASRQLAAIVAAERLRADRQREQGGLG